MSELRVSPAIDPSDLLPRQNLHRNVPIRMPREKPTNREQRTLRLLHLRPRQGVVELSPLSVKSNKPLEREPLLSLLRAVQVKEFGPRELSPVRNVLRAATSLRHSAALPLCLRHSRPPSLLRLVLRRTRVQEEIHPEGVNIQSLDPAVYSKR